MYMVVYFGCSMEVGVVGYINGYDYLGGIGDI